MAFERTVSAHHFRLLSTVDFLASAANRFASELTTAKSAKEAKHHNYSIECCVEEFGGSPIDSTLGCSGRTIGSSGPSPTVPNFTIGA